MNKGGSIDLGFCSITMVSADHSSGCPGDTGISPGGAAAGFILNIPGGDSIYHAGDTGCFGDMALISKLYEPSIALIPVGGHFTMGPREAAYALANLLTSIKVAFPMHFGTFPLLKGTPEEFRKYFDEFSLESGRAPVLIIDPRECRDNPIPGSALK